jgi:hypothetical protein
VFSAAIFNNISVKICIMAVSFIGEGYGSYPENTTAALPKVTKL